MKKSRHGAQAPESASTRTGLEDSPSHLLHRVLQIALDIYSAETGEGALTQRQYALLKALDGPEAQAEGLSQTDLVRLTGIDRSTLADLVARMLAKSLLKRERSSTDGRANLVQIDDAGRAALAEMQPRVLIADEKILSLLSPPKRDSFVKLLRKITSAREEELTASGEAGSLRKDKAGKGAAGKDEARVKAKKTKKKAHKKDDSKKLARKLKKLPFPPLSEGAIGEAVEEHVVAPAIKAAS